MPGSGQDAVSYKEEKFAKWFFYFILKDIEMGLQ
jgi:hypothetical protein